MVERQHTGTLQLLSLEQLLLDWRNPRLKPSEQLADDADPSGAAAQELLALIMNEHYHPVRVAESISEHEYFHSEPMIAVAHGDSRYRVIEGNRRLTALRGLTDPALREKFAQENRAWRSLPDYSPEETGYPVLVVGDESAVAPLLGYRHISGIEPWAAYAQARYVADLVRKGKSLDDIAELVGKTKTSVRSMYRNLDILEQAETQFGLDVEKARKSFGVFSNAMGRQGIRDFIGAPAPREVDVDTWPIPTEKRGAIEELLGLMFGSDEKPRVVTDSRQLGDLSKVLAQDSGEALKVLRLGGDLDLALHLLNDADQRVSAALNASLRALRSALEAGIDPAQVSSNTRLLLIELHQVLVDLEEIMGDRAT